MWELCQENLSCLFNSNICSMMPGQKKPMMNLLCLQLLQCRYHGPIVIIMGNGNMSTVSTMPCLSSSSCHLQMQVACDVYGSFSQKWTNNGKDILKI